MYNLLRDLKGFKEDRLFCIGGNNVIKNNSVIEDMKLTSFILKVVKYTSCLP